MCWLVYFKLFFKILQYLKSTHLFQLNTTVWTEGSQILKEKVLVGLCSTCFSLRVLWNTVQYHWISGLGFDQDTAINEIFRWSQWLHPEIWVKSFLWFSVLDFLCWHEHCYTSAPLKCKDSVLTQWMQTHSIWASGQNQLHFQENSSQMRSLSCTNCKTRVCHTILVCYFNNCQIFVFSYILSGPTMSTPTSPTTTSTNINF